ncbi:hypothetical protein EVAR_47877_1 [Eumeta japonica]|uniref:Uncharacterized protein n=1 Tax=Eumeta variegata TaxID=151549 RepID=A0A4C1YAL2_EUMVA|nr:hypothetical protein EVAR_47877_1 [Eumeta japonica]
MSGEVARESHFLIRFWCSARKPHESKARANTSMHDRLSVVSCSYEENMPCGCVRVDVSRSLNLSPTAGPTVTTHDMINVSK